AVLARDVEHRRERRVVLHQAYAAHDAGDGYRGVVGRLAQHAKLGQPGYERRVQPLRQARGVQHHGGRVREDGALDGHDELAPAAGFADDDFTAATWRAADVDHARFEQLAVVGLFGGGHRVLPEG